MSGSVPLDPVFSWLDYAALEDIGWVVQPPAMAAVIPQATGIVSVTHSRKGITSITIGFNEALEPGSADNRGLYSVLEGVKKRKKTVFNKADTIKSISYDGNNHTVAIKFARAYKGMVRATVDRGIVAADGASSSSAFSAVAK